MVDVTSLYQYPEKIVCNAGNGATIPGATGQARLAIGGPALPIYSLDGSPLAQLVADSYGVCPEFLCDSSGEDVYYDFGVRPLREPPKSAAGALARVTALETRISGVESSAQVAATSAAQAAADAAAAAAAAQASGGNLVTVDYAALVTV